MRLERAIGALTALVVGAVTALAFAQSFHALRTFAEAQRVVPAGWGWMFAATIDGFVLAALLTSLSLSLQGDRGAAPWAVRLLAVTAAAISLVFNLQHVPAGMARWGAAVPPVAVLAGLEVLLLQVRRAANRHGIAASPPPRQPRHPASKHAGTLRQSSSRRPRPCQAPQPEAARNRPGGGATGTQRSQMRQRPALPLGVPEATSAEAAARQQARQLYDQQTAAGQRVTGAALGRAIGRSERYGRLLLAEFRAEDEGSAIATATAPLRQARRPNDHVTSDERIAELLAVAPPLSDAQVARLRQLLSVRRQAGTSTRSGSKRGLPRRDAGATVNEPMVTPMMARRRANERVGHTSATLAPSSPASTSDRTRSA